jgi:hypothetical protein
VVRVVVTSAGELQCFRSRFHTDHDRLSFRGANEGVPEVVVSPSPTTGIYEIVVFGVYVPGGGGTFPISQTVANTQGVQTTLGVPSNFNQLNSLLAKARNSITLQESVPVNIIPSTTLKASIAGLTTTTSTLYVLPPPKALRIQSVFNGTAQLVLRQVPGGKSTRIELWSNAVNDSGTASLVSTDTNADVVKNEPAAPGSVKFYWARTKNAADSKFSGFSKPMLAVF